MVALKCPECGETTQLEEDMKSGFCLHCGGKIVNDTAAQPVPVLGVPDAEHHIRVGYRGLFPKVLITIDDKECYGIRHNETIKIGVVSGEHVLSLRTNILSSAGGELDRLSFVTTGDHDFLIKMGGKLRLKLKIHQLK